MKIFLAGFYPNRKLFFEMRPKYVLESFAYLKEDGVPFLNYGAEFLLDSGAFTFLAKGGASQNIDWTAYVNRYAEFIKRHKFENFFELDIYKIIGIEETENLRRRLEDLTGRASIPVWHRHLGREYLERLSSDYDYIGFGGFALKNISQSEYKFIPNLLEICRRNGCRVHGLGFTNQEQMRGACRFYSVDSTTWNGHRFGKVYVFDRDRILHIPRRDGFRTRNTSIRHNLKEWIKFQNYADLYL